MVPLKNLLWVFGVLISLGTVLTIPLYKFNLCRFIRSAIFVKIVFWIPIFLVFIGILYAKGPVRLVLLALILILCLVEILVAVGPAAKYVAYYLLFAAGLAHLILLGTKFSAQFVNILITLCLATVLADVCAFFMGNYLGKHKLPSWLNPRKSWEGATGEVVGAFLGISIVNVFIEPVISLWLFLPIGLGCVLGDLANSYFKRQAGLNNWSSAIPGHGGFIDRLSSLAGSGLLTFYFLKVTGLS